MTLMEACQSAREGNFVSHECFSNGESMHEYKSNLYYEDGANLSANGGLDFLESQTWAKEGWFVKYPKEKVDREHLDKMHKQYKSIMLDVTKSYEECIIK